MEFKKKITAVQCYNQKDDLSDVAYLVHWRYDAIHESGIVMSDMGSTPLKDPDPLTFTPFDQLTEDDVFSWIEESINIPRVQEHLIQRIDEKINPTTSVKFFNAPVQDSPASNENVDPAGTEEVV